MPSNSTDRITIFDTLRTITDRLGNTVLLGDAVLEGAMQEICVSAASWNGTSTAVAPFQMTTIANALWFNGSFGIWYATWNIPAIGALNTQGTSLASVPFQMNAVATLTFDADDSVIGEIIFYAGSSAPAGWLECDGSAISRTTYAGLFAVVGTTYGAGDGSTTFNLPDNRGYFLRGYDHGAGRDIGRTIGSTQTASLLTHNHGITDNGHAHGVSDGGHQHRYHIVTDSDTFARSVSGGSSPHVQNLGDGTNTAANYVHTETVGTGVSINGATTGISTNNAGAGDNRPINIAYMTLIKF